MPLVWGTARKGKQIHLRAGSKKRKGDSLLLRQSQLLLKSGKSRVAMQAGEPGMHAHIVHATVLFFGSLAQEPKRLVAVAQAGINHSQVIGSDERVLIRG